VQELSAAPLRLWNQDFLVLGFVAYILTGLLLFTSVGRGRPAYRVASVFGTAANSLGALRDAVQAKARGQLAALYFVAGSACLLASFQLPELTVPYLLWGGLIFELTVAVGFLALLKQLVASKLRRYLRSHLLQHPFNFEDHINLTRDVGELFGVSPHGDETLEGYVSKVRKAIGISDSPSRLFRVH